MSFSKYIGILISVLLISCNKVETDQEKLSYSRGYAAGQVLKNEGVNIDVKAYTLGLKAGIAADAEKVKQYIKPEEMIAAENKLAEDKSKNLSERIQKNKDDGENFLKANLQKPNVKVTPSGLQYEVIKLGEGPLPKLGDIVKGYSVSRLVDGKIFEKYESADNQPIQYVVKNQLPGWQEGVQLMPVGSKFNFYIPSSLAYGTSMRGDLLPYTVLIYEIEIVEIVKPAKPDKAKKNKK
jgi:FKBP-type peptidyl-prolyl cis-trans isomerase